MIVCPNCSHPNPDGAVQCEACYTPLPMTTNCPNCGATVQADASFCGQCGYNLRSVASSNAAPTVAPDVPLDVPPLVPPDPLAFSEPLVVTASSDPNPPDSSPLPPTAVAAPNPDPENFLMTPEATAESLLDPQLLEEPQETSTPEASIPEPFTSESSIPEEDDFRPSAPDPFAQFTEGSVPPPTVTPEAPLPEVETPPPPPEQAPSSFPASPAAPAARTQLQQVSGRLVHLQSDREIELPQNLSVIHIGKPNDRIPPDIDVSGFPNSEIVSRIHSDIRVEGDAYYIEDVGSSNGTYINNLPLLPGNRHRLRPGDRISLGKGDLVTFLFQIS